MSMRAFIEGRDPEPIPADPIPALVEMMIEVLQEWGKHHDSVTLHYTIPGLAVGCDFGVEMETNGVETTHPVCLKKMAGMGEDIQRRVMKSWMDTMWRSHRIAVG